MTIGATPAAQYRLRTATLHQAALPLVVEPDACGCDPHQALAQVQACVHEHLERVGAILFRGFDFSGADSFHRFAAGFGDHLLNYEFGSTPRSSLGKGVYTSTEYPAHQRIALHNEQSYTRRWPMRIWFHCPLPASEGGETPIADSRLIYNLVDPAIRRRFNERGLMYVRNSGNGLDVPWQQVFGTEDRQQVQAYCQAHDIACEWRDDGELRTRQVCQATAVHPATGEAVWFNQAHLFHVSALEPQVRQTLLELVEPPDLPRNVYYGDGSEIEDSVLDEIRGVLDSQTVAFAWRQDDVLMLDNMLVAHARAPFKGPRKVVVAMARDHGA